MSVRATIVLLEEKKLTAIYLHHDGHRAGPTLVKHYSDLEKVRELVALGALSTLGSEIGEAHDFNSTHPSHEDWCLAYHRDRGEPINFLSRRVLGYIDAKEVYDLLQEEGLAQHLICVFREGRWHKWNLATTCFEQLCPGCGDQFLDQGRWQCEACDRAALFDMDEGRFCIARAAFGVTLNGYEFLLSEFGQPMEFETRAEAKAFCGKHGIPQASVEILDLEEVSA